MGLICNEASVTEAPRLQMCLITKQRRLGTGSFSVPGSRNTVLEGILEEKLRQETERQLGEGGRWQIVPTCESRKQNSCFVFFELQNSIENVHKNMEV